MLIGMISDLHVDINKDYPVVDRLSELVRESGVEVLLIAGDISDSAELTLQTLNMLEQATGSRIYFVPGNHDMWDKPGTTPGELRTQEIYENYKKSKYCISEKAVLLNGDWVLIGNIGWYDYSFGNGFSKEMYQMMQYGERIWHDRLFSKWSRENEKTHRWQLETLRQAVQPYRDKHKILMTHMVSHEAFTVPADWSETVNWSYFNAFLGTKDYRRFCTEEQIDYALMGHVHYRGERKDGATTYVCSCLNYSREWKSTDFLKELALSLRVIMI